MLGEVRCLNIECGDCGRERWLRPHEFLRGKMTETTPLSDYMNRLVCADCLEDGLTGRNLVAVPTFYEKATQNRAETWRLNSRAARATG